MFTASMAPTILLLTKKLVPHIAAEIGAIPIKGGADDRNNRLLNNGAGVKYFLTKDLEIRGDVRYIITEGSNNVVNHNLIYSWFDVSVWRIR